jgi:hypothetical protein
MKKIQTKDIWLMVAQVLLLSLILLSPGLISHLTMKAVEQMLPADKFLRIHRSYIVAIDKIQKIDRNDCVYIGKEVIHVPDGYLPTFRSFLESRRIKGSET